MQEKELVITDIIDYAAAWHPNQKVCKTLTSESQYFDGDFRLDDISRQRAVYEVGLFKILQITDHLLASGSECLFVSEKQSSTLPVFFVRK